MHDGSAKRKPGRPVKPMSPLADECAAGALSLDDAAKILAVCKREVERIIGRGELEVVYHGRKPRVLKQQLNAGNLLARR